MPSDLLTAEALRVEGNILFGKGKYQAAIEKYSEALAFRPGWQVLYVNRALCYRKLLKWEQVERDCNKALEASDDSIKAHYFLGVALHETHRHDEAVKHLTKALELARAVGDQIKDDVWRELSRAQYARWEQQSELRSQQQQRLRSRLQQLLRKAHKEEARALELGLPLRNGHSALNLQKMQLGWRGPQKGPHSSLVDRPATAGCGGDSKANGTSGVRNADRGFEGGRGGGTNRKAADAVRSRPLSHDDDESAEGSPAARRWGALTEDQEVPYNGRAMNGQQESQIRSSVELQELQQLELQTLDEMFEAASTQDRAGEPANSYVCPLTMSVYRDPVCTPSGMSYERSALLEHLAKVGQWDPVTREPMSASQITPNNALRSATLHYLAEHPWAWAECS